MLMILRPLCSTQTSFWDPDKEVSPVPTGPFPLVGCDIGISNLTRPRLNSLFPKYARTVGRPLLGKTSFHVLKPGSYFPSCCAFALHIQPISRFCWSWFLPPSPKHPFLLLLGQGLASRSYHLSPWWWRQSPNHPLSPSLFFLPVLSLSTCEIKP